MKQDIKFKVDYNTLKTSFKLTTDSIISLDPPSSSRLYSFLKEQGYNLIDCTEDKYLFLVD